MSQSYNRLKKLSQDRIDKKSTIVSSTVDYSGVFYILLVTVFLLFILSLF